MAPSAQRSAPTLSAEDFAYSRLISYAAYQWPEYRDAPHHRLIARKLDFHWGELKLVRTVAPDIVQPEACGVCG